MKSSEHEPFSDLKWFRIRIELLNIRRSPFVKEHPFTILESIFKGILTRVEEDRKTAPPSGFQFFFHIKNRKHSFSIRKSDLIPVELFFSRTDQEFVERWKQALLEYLDDPVTGRNFDLYKCGPVEKRSYKKIAEENSFPLYSEGGVCLEFLTPLSFPFQKTKGRTYLSAAAFIRAFEQRFKRLFGKDILFKEESYRFSLLPYYWRYTELRHSSGSQPGNTQYIKGCAGNLYVKGDLRSLYPFLLLGSELHTGSKTSNSQGYYLLHSSSLPYFDLFFPSPKNILSVLEDVLDKYDNALEALSLTESFPFSEDEFTKKIAAELGEGVYKPLPNKAFHTKKRDGTDRLVEQLSFRDLIVQQYLLKTISPVFDRMFEQGSIGFRKGMSVENAITMIQTAIRDGYRYAVESDVEDFFPSVNLKKLEELLRYYLPEKDTCLIHALLFSIQNSYTLDGVFHSRKKGLAQGSPLSPVLANLYLDSFDEMILESGFRMVRYGDDFVILTKTREEAEQILCDAEDHLSGLGLQVKKEKTAITDIKEGFQFLGIFFDGTESPIYPEKGIKLAKKPLYISSPDMFLSLNGAAIDIRKGRKLIETIPIRRISEIMVMNRGVVSTALIRRCTESHIPLTINLASGYYITTIKPDSKKYYDLTFRHGQKFASLSAGERLMISKKFAAGKIRNYISFFKQRYDKEMNAVFHEMEDVIQRIYLADSVESVRGLEGAMAKKIIVA